MSCPTCDHTMQKLQDAAIWWCPRCGTISEVVGKHTAPKLVERVRHFERTYLPIDSEGWVALGVAESINTEKNRWPGEVCRRAHGMIHCRLEGMPMGSVAELEEVERLLMKIVEQQGLVDKT